MREDTGKRTQRNPHRIAPEATFARAADLLLPGAFLVAIGAKLLAPFVFVDFGFPAFFDGTHNVMCCPVNIQLCSRGIQ
jgi:hypothetical protein